MRTNFASGVLTGVLFAIFLQLGAVARAEWAQVYWLKRQALSLEAYSACGETE